MALQQQHPSLVFLHDEVDTVQQDKSDCSVYIVSHAREQCTAENPSDASQFLCRPTEAETA
jgi:hypothetical protein